MEVSNWGKGGKIVLCLKTVPWEGDEYMRAELRQEGKKNTCISKIKSKARHNGNPGDIVCKFGKKESYVHILTSK